MTAARCEPPEQPTWTWVREGNGPWFPMRGADPNVKGGYEKGASVTPPAVVRGLVEALEGLRNYPCPICSGDCASANPPMMHCPMQAANAALKAAKEAGV